MISSRSQPDLTVCRAGSDAGVQRTTNVNVHFLVRFFSRLVNISMINDGYYLFFKSVYFEDNMATVEDLKNTFYDTLFIKQILFGRFNRVVFSSRLQIKFKKLYVGAIAS